MNPMLKKTVPMMLEVIIHSDWVVPVRSVKAETVIRKKTMDKAYNVWSKRISFTFS